jgi:hypothetical protein
MTSWYPPPSPRGQLLVGAREEASEVGGRDADHTHDQQRQCAWRATFVLIAVVGALVAAVSAWLAPSVPGGPAAHLGARLAPVRNLRILALVTAMFLFGAVA